MRKRTFLQRMLCVLLSACMLAGLLTSLDGTFRAEAASDELDTYKYYNEDGKEVTVWVSQTEEFNYTSFPFGYSTRGGYVFAKIDVIGSGRKSDIKSFWLSKNGPCGDGTVCSSWDEYIKSGKLLKSDEVGEKDDAAYGNYEQSMFWFTEDEFNFNDTDSVVGTMISEYLQAYMHKYFDFVFYENFNDKAVECEIIWGNSVQILKNCVKTGVNRTYNMEMDRYDIEPVWNTSSQTLNRDGSSVLNREDWAVYEDGSGFTFNEGCDEIKAGSKVYKVSRVSPKFMSHCKKNDSAHYEKICYSSAEMDAAQKRLAGTDGKQAAVNGMLGKNIKDQATAFATSKITDIALKYGYDTSESFPRHLQDFMV